MKRFFGAIFFAILLLCGNVSYAQDNTQPTADPVSVVGANKGDQEVQPTPETQQNENEKKNQNTISTIDVPTQKVAIDDRTINIAEEANDWAMWQTIIGGVGLFFVIMATVFAGLAWHAAKAGADIGKDTLDETKQTNRRNLRAYVAVDNLEVVDFEIGKRLYFIVHFVNCGQTPAYDIRTNIQSNLKTPDKANKILFPKKAGHSGILGAGKKGVPMVVRYPSVLTNAQMGSFQSGALELVVGGVLTYSDIYKTRRRLTYKYYARWEPHVGTQGGTIIFSPAASKRGNRAN